MSSAVHTGGFLTRPFVQGLTALAALGALLVCACQSRPEGRAGAPLRSPAQQRNPELPRYQPPDPQQPARSFEQLLALPVEQFDLAEAVLALATEMPTASETHGAPDARATLQALDHLAERARSQLPEQPDGVDYFDALYDVALDHRPAEVFHEDRADDYDLAGTLKKNRGSCLTVGIKALAVARRMGAPIWGAQCPGHFFLRYVGPDLKGQPTTLNFDVTRPTPDNWSQMDDNFYRKWHRFDLHAQEAGCYLQPLTDRQVAAVFLASRSGFQALQKRHEAALNDAQRSLKLFPDNVTGQVNAGYACELLGRLEEAQAAYARALQLDPKSVRALNNLASLKVRDAKSSVYNAKEAERLITRALELDPDRAGLHATQGEVEAARGNWREAVRALQSAMRLDKKNERYRERFLEFRKHLRGEN